MKILNDYNYNYHKKNVQWLYKVGFSPLILSAGMHRSGSTLLFNILKEILSLKYKTNLSSGWYGDFDKIQKGNAYLIKVHALTILLRLRSKYIFYTYRDVRTAAVSANKVLNVPISIEEIRNGIKEYIKAKKIANLTIQYEKIIGNTLDVIHDILNLLSIKADADLIYNKCMNVKMPSGSFAAGHMDETLYHPGHITNTTDEEWRAKIPLSLQKEITHEFAWWFKECGYPIE
jgi:hypothetical protein